MVLVRRSILFILLITGIPILPIQPRLYLYEVTVTVTPRHSLLDDNFSGKKCQEQDDEEDRQSTQRQVDQQPEGLRNTAAVALKLSVVRQEEVKM